MHNRGAPDPSGTLGRIQDTPDVLGDHSSHCDCHSCPVDPMLSQSQALEEQWGDGTADHPKSLCRRHKCSEIKKAA